MINLEYIIDVHTHTISSGHAYSTIDENAKFASSIGMKLIAMTDHAPSMPGSATQIHFNNLKVLPEKLYDVEILKGAELNIMDFEGTVDLNEYSLKKLDIAIASLHPPCINAGTIEENTNAYVKVCENKYVSILGHTGDPHYPFHIKEVIDACERTGTLIEINNSSLKPNGSRKGSELIMKDIALMCKKRGIPVVLGSDAHFYTEVGGFELCKKFLYEIDFPTELILNTSVEKFKKHIKNLK